MNISPEIKAARFDVVLIEMIGGREVVEMLIQYYDPEAGGMTPQEIAGIHGMSESTVIRRLERARIKMHRCGVWPKGWKR